ncbi:MAG: hypothetical protein KA794_15015, partial [Candidatus Obscuribacter sp.]|nr:hypothetical protein [Candidatus Obscuribacter sp.]
FYLLIVHIGSKHAELVHPLSWQLIYFVCALPITQFALYKMRNLSKGFPDHMYRPQGGSRK